MKKKTIAVLFGGRSPEHDISIVTGLQTLNALDPELYDAFPLYVATTGQWFVGDMLRKREVYIPGPDELKRLTAVTLLHGPSDRPTLVAQARSFLSRNVEVKFDFALLAFHGLYGEDGRVQGQLEMAGVPYSGMRLLSSTVSMDKIATKRLLAETGIPLLPQWRVDRPEQGLLIPPDELGRSLPDVMFPCCIKPVHLGSSIGVSRVTNWQEVSAVLPDIFRRDDAAMLEPFVDNLVEYNVSVCRRNGQVCTSAIEQPKRSSELLDFKAKYLSGGNKGGKLPGSTSEGMLSQTRTINPKLAGDSEKNIRDWACKAFERLEGSGAPRFDFLSDSGTGQIWLNEVNPCPGSYGYFLWEAAEPPILFSTLLETLIAEGFAFHDATRLPSEPVPADAQLFKRK